MGFRVIYIDELLREIKLLRICFIPVILAREFLDIFSNFEIFIFFSFLQILFYSEMVEVWQLVSEGDGLLSLLRQSAMDQEWTEFSKFMNKLPLIGGNVSFAATCSVLK